MKRLLILILILILYASCSNKIENKFTIDLTHYDHRVEIILPKSYDTLNIWNNYSDNQINDKKMYRVQNSNLEIMKESGFFYKTDIKEFEQFTIIEPLLKNNKLPRLNVSQWLDETKHNINEENKYTKVEIDSIEINKTKFALIYIVYDFDNSTHKLLKCAVDINGQRLDMNFFTNIDTSEKFFDDAKEAIKTIRLTPIN